MSDKRDLSDAEALLHRAADLVRDGAFTLSGFSEDADGAPFRWADDYVPVKWGVLGVLHKASGYMDGPLHRTLPPVSRVRRALNRAEDAAVAASFRMYPILNFGPQSRLVRAAHEGGARGYEATLRHAAWALGGHGWDLPTARREAGL